MKKISLAIIAATLFAAPANAESNFDGFRATVSVSGNTGFGSPTLTVPADVSKGADTAVAVQADATTTPPVVGHGAVAGDTLVALGYSLGPVALELGYAKVLSSNLLVGAAVVIGYDFLSIDSSTGTKVVVPTDPSKAAVPTQLDKDNKFTSGFFGGVKLQGGIVVAPKIAVSAIVEGTYKNYTFAYPTSKTIYSDWVMGGAAGAKVEFAATDRFIIALGAKYQIAPTDITFKKDNASNTPKDALAADQKLSFGGSTWIGFVEATFRITTN